MNYFKFFIGIALFFQSIVCFGQDDFYFVFMGHNLFNDAKLLNTTIKVFDGTTVITELNTKDNNKFKVTMPYGKTYDVCFTNPKTQKMFVRVFADIPVKKRNMDMIYESDIPFFENDPVKYDTTQFQQPIHQLVFNGKNRMVDDTAYMKLVLKKIKRPQNIDPIVKAEIITPKVKEYVQLVGKLSLDNDKQTILKNKMISLTKKNGDVIAQTQTTNFGIFVFQHVDLDEADGITMNLQNNDNPTNAKIKLKSTSDILIASPVADINMNYVFKTPENTSVIPKLIDNTFSYNFGGKLITTIGSVKKTATNKTIYLLDSKNNIVQKSKTNVLGNFLFTTIISGEDYKIAFDTTDFLPNESCDIYTVKDKFVKHIEAVGGNSKFQYKFLSVDNSSFNELIVDDSEVKMNMKGRLCTNNKNSPLTNFKVLLMNDNYEVIDSCITDLKGDFLFKNMVYSKKLLLSQSNDKNISESLNNIIVYDNNDNLLKSVSIVKGNKFEYKLLSTSENNMTELFVDDPWLEFLDKKGMSKKVSGSSETIVESILFEVNKSELLSQSLQTLDKVILAMQTNKNFNIELSAHSDSRGSDVQNMVLSEKRAISAKNYIVSKGIDTKRIIAKGYGETKLRNNCGNNAKCSEDEHAENRRIEFKISYL